MKIDDIISYLCNRLRVKRIDIAEHIGKKQYGLAHQCKNNMMPLGELLDIFEYMGIKPEIYVLETDEAIPCDVKDPVEMFRAAFKKHFGTLNKRATMAGMSISAIYERKSGKTAIMVHQFFGCLNEMGMGMRLINTATGFYVAYSDREEIADRKRTPRYTTIKAMPISQTRGETGGLESELYSNPDGTYMIGIYTSSGNNLMMCTEEEARTFAKANGNIGMNIAK